MTRLRQELFVDAPPERVFAIVAAPERTPEWMPSVLEMHREGAGPIAVGSKTRSVVKVLGTRQRAIGTCVHFDPPKRLVIDSQTDRGGKSRTDTELAPEGAGSRVTVTLDYVVPGGGLGKLLDKLVAERQIREDFEAGLAALKRLAESGEG
jgi:uncharacterized protein YndB with AHSA1/START domain